MGSTRVDVVESDGRSHIASLCPSQPLFTVSDRRSAPATAPVLAAQRRVRRHDRAVLLVLETAVVGQENQQCVLRKTHSIDRIDDCADTRVELLEKPRIVGAAWVMRCTSRSPRGQNSSRSTRQRSPCPSTVHAPRGLSCTERKPRTRLRVPIRSGSRTTATPRQGTGESQEAAPSRRPRPIR